MLINCQARVVSTIKICPKQYFLLRHCAFIYSYHYNNIAGLSGSKHQCERKVATSIAGAIEGKCSSYVEPAVLAPKYATETAIDDLNIIGASKATACTPTLRQFAVRLNAVLEENELVGLTGSSKALGEWQLDRSVPLHSQGNLEWKTSVMLQSCRDISYRYFIYVEDAQGRKQIRRWETQLHPRILQPNNLSHPVVDQLGEIHETNDVQINRGWLINESIVQLKFEREKMFRVLDINKFDPEDVLVKVMPQQDEPNDAKQTGVNVEVAKMNYGESKLRPQDNFGIPYKRGEIIIFHATVPNPINVTFELIFHSPEHKLMGKAVIKSTDLTGSEGVLGLDITETFEGSNEVIAHLTLPYLIVKPFTDVDLDFRTTFAHYWPKSWPNLDVGHRGNGRSYKENPPGERENTIASFLRAYESFADMVELDVHLTSDGVPVVYHDFGLRTAPQGKQIKSPEQLEYVLIKDLTYDALKQLRIFAVINNKAVEYPAHNAEQRAEHRIFPTLIDVLENLPRSLGIDVEIKWPQLRKCGEPEALQTIDKNFFIDRVLYTVIKHGCGRPLIFSSFDADICTMIRFKQNLLPVMFLTMGETKKWTPFMDLRTRTFEQAINNAQAFDLAGSAPHAEDFLGSNGATLFKMAHNLGQIALVWGDDCNSKERVKYFSEIGATATCYDRSDLYIPEHKIRSFFNSDTLLKEFEGQCRLEIK